MRTPSALAKLDEVAAAIVSHKDRLDDHHERIIKVETNVKDIADIKEIVEKILRWIKWGLPSVISAAVAAGVVNGKLGAFLSALVH